MGPMVSGVGVVDKSAAVLEALADAGGACSLADLVARTGISRATAHRLAVALATMRALFTMTTRFPAGRWITSQETGARSRSTFATAIRMAARTGGSILVSRMEARS